MTGREWNTDHFRVIFSN